MSVVGDVPGMYRFADQLVARATTLRAARSRAKKQWASIDMEGPLGRSLTTFVAEHLRRLDNAADQLDAIAGQVRGAAFRVEQERAAEQRLREELQRQEIERQRREAARRAAAKP